MLISIIIPCYNVADYIQECIASCYTQTYKNIEVICVDNNSTDNTYEILQQLKLTYHELIVEQELKAGAPAARNKGLHLAKGEWIQFLDADDLLLPDKLEHQLKLIAKGVDFVAGAFTKRTIIGEESALIPNSEDIYKALFSTQLGITSSNLFRKSAIDKAGSWDEKLKSSQEADLMFRLLKQKSTVVFDNTPLTIIRERESGQISQRNPSEKWQLLFRIRLEMLNWINNSHPKYYQKEKTFYQDTLFSILRILAEHDLKTANKLYKQHLHPYKASKEQMHSTRLQQYLFQLFGFYYSEILRKLIKLSQNKPIG